MPRARYITYFIWSIKHEGHKRSALPLANFDSDLLLQAMGIYYTNNILPIEERILIPRLFSHNTHFLVIIIYILMYVFCVSKLCFCKFVFEWNTNRKLSIHVKILLLWNNLSYYIFHFIHTWPSVKRLEKKNKAFEIERACKFPKAFVIPYEWAIEINFVMYIASLYIFFMSP